VGFRLRWRLQGGAPARSAASIPEPSAISAPDRRGNVNRRRACGRAQVWVRPRSRVEIRRRPRGKKNQHARQISNAGKRIKRGGQPQISTAASKIRHPGRARSATRARSSPRRARSAPRGQISTARPDQPPRARQISKPRGARSQAPRPDQQPRARDRGPARGISAAATDISHRRADQRRRAGISRRGAPAISAPRARSAPAGQEISGRGPDQRPRVEIRTRTESATGGQNRGHRRGQLAPGPDQARGAGDQRLRGENQASQGGGPGSMIEAGLAGPAVRPESDRKIPVRFRPAGGALGLHWRTAGVCRDCLSCSCGW